MSRHPDLTPRLCIHLPNFAATDQGDWTALLDIACAADRAGVDKLVVSDHVVLGEHLDAYARPELGGIRGGAQPTGPDGLWLEPLTLLSVIAGCTTRIRLGTHVMLAALRRPVVLAKSAATLDVLAGGRLDLGVGVGWQREEYDAAGLDFDDRSRLLDDTLHICQTLWREQAATLEVGSTTVAGIHQMPKPRQAGGVPIWISGTVNRKVTTRLARFGAGWIPWGDDAADLVTSIPAMRSGVAAAGGDPTSLRIVGNIANVDAVPALAAAGVTDFVARIPAPAEGASAEDNFATWVAAFAAAVSA